MSAAATDTELIAAHAAGDPQAFNEIVHRHKDRMWAVALRTMRDPEDAADALQDAFISAYRAAAKFRGQSQVSTWLHRIVVNACLDRLRRRQARPTVPLPGTDDYREPAAAGDSMAQRETNLVISAALDELPQDQRGPILLVDVEGYSITEAAEILGVASGTVKSRCARGRAKLAQRLGYLRNHCAPVDVVPSNSTPGSIHAAESSRRASASSPRWTEGR